MLARHAWFGILLTLGLAAPLPAQFQEINSGFSHSGERPETFDRSNPHEPLVVLLPDGPLCVRLQVRIDGKPFRELLEEAFAIHVAELEIKPGETRWEPLLNDPRFLYGRTYAQPASVRQAFLKLHDAAADGVVSRDELTECYLKNNGGVPFELINGMPTPDKTFPDLRGVLDLDADGALSAAELTAAPARLARLDANRNGLVEPADFQPAPLLATSTNRTTYFHRLQGTFDAGRLWFEMQTFYGNAQREIRADAWRGRGTLFTDLDANRNGKLDPEEAARLPEVKPHVELAIRFGPSPKTPAELTVERVAPDLEIQVEPGKAGAFTWLRMGSAAVLVTAADRMFVPEPASMLRVLSGYDRNKDGFVEQDELPATESFFRPTFTAWDGDGDGKISPLEVITAQERPLAPQRSRIFVKGSQHPPALYATLDLTRDARLSPREIQSAAARLRRLDADRDGRLAPAEMPVLFVLDVSRGRSTFGVRTPDIGGSSEVPPTGPDWFVKMDRNADGDIELREFVGSVEQFHAFDTNRDGFLEPAEATAIRR